VRCFLNQTPETMNTHTEPPAESNIPAAGAVDVSIVIPLLNEVESLRALMEQIRETMSATGRRFETIFIDDGSTDGSMGVLEELHDVHDDVKVIQFRRNFGKAAAYVAGFDAAAGRTIITMDADLQDDPAEIPRLIEKIEGGVDLVSGWKKKRFDPLSKTIPSRFFNWVTGRISGIRIHDFNCGLKAFRGEVVRDIKIYGELHRYIPVLAHMEGYRVDEIVIQHRPRRFGVTKYGWTRLLKGFLDLLTVMYLGRYIGRPLHLFGTIGIVLSAVGVGINGFIAALWFRTGTIQHRHPLLFLGILLSVLGVQFLCTGLLADMITRQTLPNEKYNVRKVLS